MDFEFNSGKLHTCSGMCNSLLKRLRMYMCIYSRLRMSVPVGIAFRCRSSLFQFLQWYIILVWVNTTKYVVSFQNHNGLATIFIVSIIRRMLFVVYCPLREYFTRIGTSLLPVKGCKIEIYARHLRPLNREGSLSRHICYYRIPLFTRSLPTNCPV